MLKATPPSGSGSAEGLEILRPGIFTSAQDLGRPGQRRWGIPLGGALDRFALMASNLLVGNPVGAAGLEIAGGGLTLQVQRALLLCLGGGDLQASLDGLVENGRLSAAPGFGRLVKRKIDPVILRRPAS